MEGWERGAGEAGGGGEGSEPKPLQPLQPVLLLGHFPRHAASLPKLCVAYEYEDSFFFDSPLQIPKPCGSSFWVQSQCQGVRLRVY